MTDRHAHTPASWAGWIRRFGPIALLGAGLVAFVASGAWRWASIDTVAAHYQDLREAIAARPVVAGAAFVAFYAAAVSVSLPGALWITLISGLLFGWALGALYAWAGGLIGASVVFLAARTALAGVLRARAGSRLDRFKRGLERDAFAYVLLLRLIPAPFFVVNAGLGVLNIPLRHYIAGTAVGIIPAGVAYAAIGAGAGDILAEGGAVSAAALRDPKIVLGLGGLACLGALGLWVKRRSQAGRGR